MKEIRALNTGTLLFCSFALLALSSLAQGWMGSSASEAMLGDASTKGAGPHTEK